MRNQVQFPPPRQQTHCVVAELAAACSAFCWLLATTPAGLQALPHTDFNRRCSALSYYMLLYQLAVGCMQKLAAFEH